MLHNDTLSVPSVKVCKKCRVEKPETEFYLFKSGKRAGWRNATCSQCAYAQRRAWLLRQRAAPKPFVDLPLEEWRPIPGYEDRYDVSNLGRVRSWHNPHGRLEVPHLKVTYAEPKNGYLLVGLYDRRRMVHIGVSRLVLMAFVGMPDDGMEASHLNGDHTNNKLDNLAWETHFENEQHKVEHGTRPMGESQYLSKLTDEQVREIRWLRSLGFKLTELAERYGVNMTGIGKICRGESWKHVE